MPAKRPKAKKPDGYAKLSQKEKFIAAAKAADVDESGESFIRAFRKLVPQRNVDLPSSAKRKKSRRPRSTNLT